MSNSRQTNEEKLDAIYQMTLENHEILRTIRRQQYFSNAFRILYWLIILGAIGGAYYYVRPLIEVFTANGAQFDSTFAQFMNLPEARYFSQFIEAMRSMRGEAQ